MGVQLTQADVGDLKKQGYSEEEISKAIGEIEREDLQTTYQQGRNQRDPRSLGQQSSFGTKVGENDLVRWQLELNDILERAEHILRGDIVTFEQGHMIWKKNPCPEDNCLNDFGVKLIMKVLANYINRNTILSDYEQEEINYKVFDFGRELNNLIFMKYEEIGMTCEDKRKEYPMLVREVVDLVHSSYKRALKGGERRSLREMISIQQSTNAMMNNGMPVNSTGQVPQKRGILNPMRYVAGKYV